MACKDKGMRAVEILLFVILLLIGLVVILGNSSCDKSESSPPCTEFSVDRQEYKNTLPKTEPEELPEVVVHAKRCNDSDCARELLQSDRLLERQEGIEVLSDLCLSNPIKVQLIKRQIYFEQHLLEKQPDATSLYPTQNPATRLIWLLPLPENLAQTIADSYLNSHDAFNRACGLALVLFNIQDSKRQDTPYFFWNLKKNFACLAEKNKLGVKERFLLNVLTYEPIAGFVPDPAAMKALLLGPLRTESAGFNRILPLCVRQHSAKFVEPVLAYAARWEYPCREAKLKLGKAMLPVWCNEKRPMGGGNFEDDIYTLIATTPNERLEAELPIWQEQGDRVEQEVRKELLCNALQMSSARLHNRWYQQHCIRVADTGF